MDTKDTARYKELLERKKGALLREIGTDERVESFGNDVDHDEEKADEAEEYGAKLARAAALKEDVNEIDAALRKIAAGTYGRCDRCGKEIDARVLAAAPESLLCRGCKRA